jgi:hypothetical protein
MDSGSNGNNIGPQPTLNLPATRLDIRDDFPDGLRRVRCRLRGRYVALTPEEWVRQHFVAYLVDCLGYPAPLLANEVPITLNGTSRRCDTVLYSTDALAPRLIVEYKAPHIPITQKTFDQIVRYNMVLRVPWLMVSNGLSHYCCRIDYSTTPAKVRFVDRIPTYSEL